jgi:predicted  nucleic acid-binding Zn-ribbon protein
MAKKHQPKKPATAHLGQEEAALEKRGKDKMEHMGGAGKPEASRDDLGQKEAALEKRGKEEMEHMGNARKPMAARQKSGADQRPDHKSGTNHRADH